MRDYIVDLFGIDNLSWTGRAYINDQITSLPHPGTTRMVYWIGPIPKWCYNATGYRIFIIVDIAVVVPWRVYGLILICISDCIGTWYCLPGTKILAQQQTGCRRGLGGI